MNNMATKELFKFLPKYKAHKKNGTTVIITDDNGVMINLTGSVTISAGGITTQQEEIDLEAADFSDALMWLKDGKKVARRGWNGENQF
ncbi:DUF2829 domain-containing protein, partial [Salmonella enterica subsp. enterica serovar Johannesburg]|nr:DUF2829 domain-containing protein [Salmonella enterica subsp. enterica serovar Johannesburg]